MPIMDDRHNCDRLKARADQLRDRLATRDLWTLDDEGDWEEISPTGALDLWDDDDEGYAWNEVMNLCAEWTAELDYENAAR